MSAFSLPFVRVWKNLEQHVRCSRKILEIVFESSKRVFGNCNMIFQKKSGKDRAIFQKKSD